MEFFELVASVIALILLEIILGIDNVIYLSILTQKLPLEQRRSARRLGLMFAWVTRLLLLLTAVWIVYLDQHAFQIFSYRISFRDIFLIFGGLFLMMKATEEIHNEMLSKKELIEGMTKGKSRFVRVVLQVGIMDIVFSLDSVLTAVGLTSRFWVMAIAITIAIGVMIYALEWVSRFIQKYPTIKMLALSYLILIGMVLVADGFSFHIPRGYVYFAMGFSMMVESLNLLKQERMKG